MTAWTRLSSHFHDISKDRIEDYFRDNPSRADEYSIQVGNLYADFSKNHLTATTIQLLFELAREHNLAGHIDDLFTGREVNVSEHRAALHTELRNIGDARTGDDNGMNTQVMQSLQRMQVFLEQLENGTIESAAGKPFDSVVNLGIGGSDLGPRMVTTVLHAFRTSRLSVHFVANIDSAEIMEVLSRCDPESTLFIVSSKSFTTRETLANAGFARKWLQDGGITKPEKQFIAVTARPDAATTFGIDPSRIFPLPETIGGRYSVWSAVGISVAASIGMENFTRFLEGARHMDDHFRNQPLEKNLPVILGLMDIWYINFFRAQTRAVIPYSHDLGMFPDYLAQLVMESNGKSVTCEDTPVQYDTAAILWGGVGTNAQHAFMQLLHQGTRYVPVDFLVAIHSDGDPEHHRQLVCNCLAQGEALMKGTGNDQLPVHRQLPGNRPSTTILYDRLTPHMLGMLIALYEHRTYVQACIWDINPFDQWGVQLGKDISSNLAKELDSGEIPDSHDPSTQKLLGLFLSGSKK